MSKTVLEITLSEDETQYNIKAAEGISVNEMMFGIAAAIKCLVRDGVIEKYEIATDMLHRYLTDEQFAEIHDEKKN